MTELLLAAQLGFDLLQLDTQELFHMVQNKMIGWKMCSTSPLILIKFVCE